MQAILTIPSLPIDLDHGYDSFIRRDDTQQEYLDGLLRTPSVITRRQAGTLVTWRGVLTTLLCTIYEDRQGWQMEGVHREVIKQD